MINARLPLLADRVDPPLFSVVLPTYNRAKVIDHAIRSVQNQVERSWELIVVDDGSTDDTFERVTQLAEADRRIRLITQSNQGASSARNRAIHAARGRYLAFIDSDDTFTPDHLAVRLKIFLNQPDVELLYGGAQIIGNPMVVDRNDPTRLVSLEDESIRIGGTFTLLKSTALKIGGFPNVRYSEDAEFFLTAIALGIKTARVPEKTYCYDRTSADSICTEVLKASAHF